MAITITGKLTKVELKKIKDPDYLGVGRYSPNSERYLHYVNCCVTTEDGSRYFFDSPKVRQTVTSGGGVALVHYWIEGEAEKWFELVEGSSLATTEKANTNSIRPLVSVGDTITIRATVKQVKPTYTAVNRVKKI